TAAERLLVRAGYIRAVSTGVYGYLPLGMRAMARIQRTAREELSTVGAQEVLLAESAAAEIARGELRSAKQLPQVWFRIEADSLRMRQFVGLDVYWFGADRAAIQAAFGAHCRTVWRGMQMEHRRRCGVERSRTGHSGCVRFLRSRRSPRFRRERT